MPRPYSKASARMGRADLKVGPYGAPYPSSFGAALPSVARNDNYYSPSLVDSVPLGILILLYPIG